MSDSKLQVLDVVQLKVKHRFKDSFMFIEALIVPVICSPLKKQHFSASKENNKFLSNLTLADFEDDESSHECRVGILVGVDFYNNLFLGKRLKNAEGLAAFSTVLGWVLSGPVSFEDSSVLQILLKPIPCVVDSKQLGQKVIVVF